MLKVYNVSWYIAQKNSEKKIYVSAPRGTLKVRRTKRSNPNICVPHFHTLARCAKISPFFFY